MLFLFLLYKKPDVTKNSTEAMKDSQILDYANMMSTLQYRILDFEEFCAATISVHQLEGMESWEQHACSAYELFEKNGNRPIMIEKLASEGTNTGGIGKTYGTMDYIRPFQFSAYPPSNKYSLSKGDRDKEKEIDSRNGQKEGDREGECERRVIKKQELVQVMEES
ncbi:hypothetical protein RHMOL_Rhmol10G0286100 [Rhododendron molle]|uniref:Uncharacterized protein n=1 Tax=Rhododendron molle TaxID=49168 RepID=A0ACC0M8C9_RHOML|nr:hypothetical protein RHMOL_Rhmol10G0286100 [Rhododendron molle]